MSNPTTSVSGQGLPLPSNASQPPPLPSPSQSPNIFNNSSLLFGFLFLIVLVVFTIFALTSRFFARRRRRLAQAVLGGNDALHPIPKESPKLLDIYIQTSPSRTVTWKTMKPLSVETVSQPPVPVVDDDRRMLNSGSNYSNGENLRNWLTSHQAVSYVWPAYFMRARETLQSSNNRETRLDSDEKHEETAIEDTDFGSLNAMEIDVTTIIMMPRPENMPHTSMDLVYENAQNDFYYELGTAHITV